MAAAIANSDSDSYSPKRLMPLLAAHRAVLGAVAVLGHRSALVRSHVRWKVYGQLSIDRDTL